MDDRSHQQRASDAAAGLRKLSSEEEARLKLVLLPYASMSLVLQCLLLVVGVRTIRDMYCARHLGVRPLLSAAGGPLLGLFVLNLAQVVINRRLRKWVKRLTETPPGQAPHRPPT
jgi:hypothetical protein